MTFWYPLHNQILRVLQSIDRQFFQSCKTYFGGGHDVGDGVWGISSESGY